MEKEKKCPECTHRIKKRTEEETKLMINRLNRIEGQVRGIRRMVEKKSDPNRLRDYLLNNYG